MNTNPLPLHGQIALVTGAGRGIGSAMALALAGAGARVCCAARSSSELDETVTAIHAGGGEAIAFTCDISDPQDVDRMVERTVRAFGGIDLLVANAGMSGDGQPLETSDVAQWKRTIDVNLFGTYLCARAVVPAMKARGGGKIVTVGSGMGHRPAGGVSAYSCSKAATWMLTRVLAIELEPFGIAVNELVPGPVVTQMTSADFAQQQLGTTALQGEWFKQPEDVVPLLMFLATQPAKGPTAQSLSLARRPL